MRAEVVVQNSGARLVRALAVGGAYGLLAYLSLSLTRFGSAVESIWLCNALLTWGLVTSRRDMWLPTVAAAAIGHVTAHTLNGDAFNFTLAFLAGDMLECVFCALMLNLRPRTLRFEDRKSAFYFLLICGLAAPFLSAVIAAAASWAIGRDLSVGDFTVWFSADALGLIVFLPIFYAIGEGRWRGLLRKPLHAAVAVAMVVVVSFISGWLVSVPTLRLLLLPVFVLIAFDLGVAGVQICLGALALVWVGLTLDGRPPTPWVELSMRDYMLVLQVFLAIFAATVLPLAVAIEEKQRLNATLAETLKETQEAWGAIIGAEARYRLVVDNVSETVMRVAADGLILFATPACVALLHGDHEFEGRNLFELMHPDDRAMAKLRFTQVVEQGLFNLVQRGHWRLRGDDDSWARIDGRVTMVGKPGAGREEFVVVLRPEYA